MNGYDRLKEQYLKLNDKEDALKKIITFLMKHPNMSELYLNEEKDLTGMMKYIKDKAKDKAINNVAVIEDTEVYNWAVTYFSESNADLGIKEQTMLVKSNTTTTKEDSNKDQLKLELDVY